MKNEWGIKRLYKNSISFRWTARFFVLSTIIGTIIALIFGGNLIFVSQKESPCSVATVNNKGDITINCETPDRQLNAEIKSQISENLPKNKKTDIVIIWPSGNFEAKTYLLEIDSFIKSKGYIPRKVEAMGLTAKGLTIKSTDTQLIIEIGVK